MNSTLHEPKTPVERRANRQLWLVTLITTALILLIALAFVLIRAIG